MRQLLGIALLAIAATADFGATPSAPPAEPTAKPAPRLPALPREPKRPVREQAESVAPAVGAKVGGKVSPAGEEIHCDLPDALHLKNVGGSDGAGLCVFTSIAHSARWQCVPLLEDFRDWMRKYPGGGWPEKVDAMVKRIASEKASLVPAYLQIQDNDLEILKAACRSGRMPSVTYCYSPTGRYGGARIAHMVSLVHADDDWFCVLDNNYPGVARYEWMTPSEFLRVYRGSRTGWAVILISPGPPPVPRNGPAVPKENV